MKDPIIARLIEHGESFLGVSNIFLPQPEVKAWYSQCRYQLERVFGNEFDKLLYWPDYSDYNEIWGGEIRAVLNALEIAQDIGPMSEESSEDLQNHDGIANDVDPRVFIVHGHDDQTKYELKNYLQNTIGFEEPIVLHEQPNNGKTIIEKFETHAEQTDISFVILTPDDLMASPSDSNSEKRRARQNVIFEMGYFLGMFRRRTGRIILLEFNS